MKKSPGLKTLSLALGLALLGVASSNANALYDTTMPGHNIRHVVLYSNAITGGHPTSRVYLRQNVAYLARKYGFKLDTVGNGSSATGNAYNFTPAYLSGVQILMTSNGDGNVFTTDSSQSAVVDYVENKGGSLFMIHAANAFIPCPTNGQEFIDTSTCKFLGRIVIREYYNHNNAGTPAVIYADSVLPGNVPGTGVSSPYCTNLAIPLIVTDHPHGIMNPETKNIYLSKDERGTVLPRSWTSKDEWYTYRNNVVNAYYQNVRATAPRVYGSGISHGNPLNGVIGAAEGNVNVLFSMDETHVGTAATNGGTGASIPTCPVLGSHPQTWTRKMGMGLGAYNMMGHDENETGTGDLIYTQNDSAYVRVDWRIMRYLAGDFTGCMDSNYVEYNPEATVTTLTGKNVADSIANAATYPKYPCKTIKGTAIFVTKGAASSQGITSSQNGIRIGIPQTGVYRVSVSDLKGRQVYSKTAAGGLDRALDVQGLRNGTYFVRVMSPKSGLITKRVSLY